MPLDPRATKSLSDLGARAEFLVVRGSSRASFVDAATVSSIIGNARCPSPPVDVLLQFVNNQNSERR